MDLRPNIKTYLYLMHTARGRPLLKVGITWNIRLRSRQLELQRKRKLKLAAYRAFPCEYEAKRAEQSFHKWAQNGMHRSEWYPANQEIVARFMSQESVVICG